MPPPLSPCVNNRCVIILRDYTRGGCNLVRITIVIVIELLRRSGRRSTPEILQCSNNVTSKSHAFIRLLE